MPASARLQARDSFFGRGARRGKAGLRCAFGGRRSVGDSTPKEQPHRAAAHRRPKAATKHGITTGSAGPLPASVSMHPHLATSNSLHVLSPLHDSLDAGLLLHEGMADAGPHAALLSPSCCSSCGVGPVCELDVRSDPVDTLQQLRHCLTLHGSSTLLVLDGRPNLLLDACSLLHLLNQDLRLDEDYSTVVVFQPMLADGPLSAHGTAVSGPAAGRLSRPPTNSMALHVTKLRAPGLLQQIPSSVVAYTPPSPTHPGPSGYGGYAGGYAPTPSHPGGGGGGKRGPAAAIPRSATLTEVWSITEQIVERLDTSAMTQLRCVGPRSLVVAFRAIKRARKLLQLAGDWDLLVSPHIVSDKSMVCFNCWRTRAVSPSASMKGYGAHLGG